MYNGALYSPQLGDFDPNNAEIVNALSGAQPAFSGLTPQTQALMSAISGREPSRPVLPAPPVNTGAWPVPDAMAGSESMEPTPSPMGHPQWGMMTPEEGRAEVAGALPGYARDVEAKTAEAEKARALSPEAPALSFMGMPVVSSREAQAATEQNLAEAQAKKAHAEAQLAGEAALPTTTPLRNAAERALQSVGTTYTDVPKFTGYIGGWLANEAGLDVKPTDNAVFRLGDNAEKWVKNAFPGDEARQDEFGSKAAHMMGFLGALYGPGGVNAMTEGGTRLAAKIGEAALASSATGMSGFEGATKAMEKGAPVSERDRAFATLLHAGVGLTSMIPMASAMATPGEKTAGAIMAEALKGSGVNASQMAAFNVLNNAIAKEYYDPKRSLTQGLESDVGLGMIAGGVTHGAAAALGPKRLSTPEEIHAFIEAARRSDPDPVKAEGGYWDHLHELADTKLKQLPAPGAAPEAKPGEAPPEPHAPAPQASAPEIVRKPEGAGFSLEIPSDNPKSPVARAVVTPDPYRPGTASIKNVWVRDDMRRQGIASRLYDHAEAELAKEGLKLVPSQSLKQAGFDFWKARNPAAVAHDIRSYEPEIRRWAKENYGSDANVAFREGGSQATVFNSNGRRVADLDAEGLREDGVIPGGEPGKLAEAGPYALRNVANWREEAHGNRPLREGEGIRAPGGIGEEARGPGGRAVQPGPQAEASGVRPIVGGETLRLQDRNGVPLVGVISSVTPSEKYKSAFNFEVHLEGTTAETKPGKPVATVAMRQHPDGTWDIGMMKTHKDFERRGIMSNALDAIEQRVGQKLGGSGIFWEPGYNLWQKRDPEAVKYHQFVESEGGYASPAEINRQIIDNKKRISELDPIKDWEYIQSIHADNKKLQEHLDSVPPEGKTPEKLASPLALRGFYNPATRAVEESKQGAMPGDQWLKMLQGAAQKGVQRRHLEELGVPEFLEGKGKVTKQELLDHMRINEAPLEEQVLSKYEPSPQDKEAVEHNNRIHSEVRNLNDRIYQLESIIESLPEGSEERKSYNDEADRLFEETVRLRSTRIPVTSDESTHQGPKFSQNTPFPKGSNPHEFIIRDPRFKGQYNESHWMGTNKDYPAGGPVALHIRTWDLDGPNGEKILGVGEVQSTLHQQGRQEGYNVHFTEEDNNLLEELINTKNRLEREDNATPNYIGLPEEERARRRHQLDDVYREIYRLDALRTRVPKAALSDSWLEVGMKRALQYAAENGYDGVTWAKSEQIAPAVGARPEALAADYDKKIPSWFQKTAKKYGAGSGDVMIGRPTEKSLETSLADYDKPLSDSSKHYLESNYYNIDSALSEVKRYGNQSTIRELENLKSWWDQNRHIMAEPNAFIRINDKMRDDIMQKGMPLAAAPDRVAKMMETSLKAGKPVNISTSALNQAHEAIAPMRHVVPEDTGIHVLSRIEPHKEGLLATFTDQDGKPFQLIADSFLDLSNLRGLTAEDGAKIVIANIGAGKRAHEVLPASASEIGANDPHTGVLFHEGVHSLYRRGLIPADDWSRLAQHASSFNLMDMPIGQYLNSIGEKSNVGRDVPLRTIYENAYKDLPAAESRALIEEEEPVAHMMELFHHGHFKGDEMAPITDLLQKFVGGEYAKTAPKAPEAPEAPSGGQSLEDIQGSLEAKIKALYSSEFPKKDPEDFATHGWWALGEGKSSYGDKEVLNRIREKHPELVKQYKDAYQANREARLNDVIGNAAE